MGFLQGYLNKFSRNFLVSSMIPSLAFLAITLAVLHPFLSNSVVDVLGKNFNPLGTSGMIILLLTVMLAFTLTSLNTYIYKIFEGYVFFGNFPFLRNSEIKRSRRMKSLQQRLQQKIDRLENLTSQRAVRKRNDLVAIRESILAEYDLEFPPSEDQIMPTRFGNIFKAAECYARSRYRIDSVPIWPRLIHVIPSAYFSKVDQVNDQLSFLMNCTVLAFLFSFVSVSIAIYSYWMAAGSTPSIEIGLYFLLFIIALLISWTFLKASVFVVVEYGNMIRSSFDLFRQDLLKQLHLKVPRKLSKEQSLWEDISDFINVGDKGGLIDFKFERAQVKYPNPQNRSISENADN